MTTDHDHHPAGHRSRVALLPLAPVTLDDLPGLPTATVRLVAARPSGVRFELRVVNDGDEAVTLANPYEAITFTLADETGTPVERSAPARNAKVHAKTPPSLDRKLDYLALDEVSIGGRDIGVEAALTTAQLDLAPGEDVVYQFCINATVDRASSSERDGVAPGAYTLAVLLPVQYVIDGQRWAGILRTVRDLEVVVAD